MNAKQSYDALIVELREIALLSSVSSLLAWDERTQLPAKGAEHRGNQSALLARMIHERSTSPKIGDWLAAVENSDLVGPADSDVATNVRETRRKYDRKRKLPVSLVEEQAKLEVMAQHAWAEARRKSDFAAFAPWLEKTLALKKQEANCLGYCEHIYDALLEDFEPGCTTAEIRRVFEELRAPLVELIRRIGQSGRRAPAEILERDYPAAAQETLACEASALVGFDFQAGRLDVSVHPFCTDIGPGDVRLTTRYDPKYFGDAFFGVLHETGHGLYEQGLPVEHFGTPCGLAISLGIHESQSRLWENFVGRGRAFWRFFWPKVRSTFASETAGVSDEDWYRAINDVRPSFIRTESDETTYNLHILLRFELEQAMLTGEVAVSDLPEAWNRKMNDYLGITPPDAARGVLQDIHWSGGGIGYFPTYTLGNLYAAQFFAHARHDLGDLDAHFARGDFAPLLGWLRKNIHAHGRRYSAANLVRNVTGQSLSAKPLLEHLNRKAAEVYGV
jgi:carboxypeptidase Taq